MIKNAKICVVGKDDKQQRFSLHIDFEEFNKMMGDKFQYNYPKFEFEKIEIVEMFGEETK